MEDALKWGDDKPIKEAGYNWQIVTSIVDDLREGDGQFAEPSLVEQVIYDEEGGKRPCVFTDRSIRNSCISLGILIVARMCWQKQT